MKQVSDPVVSPSPYRTGMPGSPRIIAMSGTFETESSAVEALRRSGFEPEVVPLSERKGWTEEDYIRRLEGRDGLIAGADFPISARILETGLKAVSLNCTGTDHVALARATELGIPVYNTPGLSYDACADLSFGLMLAVMRRIVQGDHAIRSGRWNAGCERSPSVSGKTLGILGLGSIGLAVCRRAKGFGMEVLAQVRHPKPELAVEHGFSYVSREDLLARSDVLFICCPLTPETRGTIDTAALAALKPGTVLINASRGPIVDTAALIDALQSGHLFGAGLDVYDQEPLRESPLFKLDNVVLTPHLAGLADAQIEACAVKASENLIAFFQGTAPFSLVNPDALGKEALR